MSRYPFHRQLLALVLALLVATPAAAQHQVMLLHGFVSNGSAWGNTADRLRAEFEAVVTAPDADWRRHYMDQAVDLDRRNILSTAHPVFVGHSNGGQVARNWSRIRVPEAIVTIGTPHQGAPLIPQFWNWAVFGESGITSINNVGEAFARAQGSMWVLGQVLGALNFLGQYTTWSVVYLAASLGLNEFADVAQDMRPGSAAIDLINGYENMARERTMIPSRVGIVSVAHNFYFAGPARAIDPEWADRLGAAMYGAAAVLATWGSYLWITADPGDLDALDAALSMFVLVGHILAVDRVYCNLVSSVNGAQCVANDGVVPYTSQEYPSAANVYLGANNDGPTHTREMQQSGVIADVLRTYTNLPPRVGTPPPPPPPWPSPGPGQPGPAPPANALDPDMAMTAGSVLRSHDGGFTLVYQDDSNLVLYAASGAVLWAAGITTASPGTVVMQGDGNLVMYDAGGQAVWATNTGVPNSRLVVQDDGNVVIYAPDGTPVWATGTYQ